MVQQLYTRYYSTNKRKRVFCSTYISFRTIRIEYQVGKSSLFHFCFYLHSINVLNRNLRRHNTPHSMELSDIEFDASRRAAWGV